MDPLVQITLMTLVFAAAAYGVFRLSMRSDRRRNAPRRFHD